MTQQFDENGRPVTLVGYDDYGQPVYNYGMDSGDNLLDPSIMPSNDFFPSGLPIGMIGNPRASTITENSRIANDNPLNPVNAAILKSQIVTNIWGEFLKITDENYSRTQRAISLSFPDEPRTIDVYIHNSDNTNPSNARYIATFGSRNGVLIKELTPGSHTLGGNNIYLDIINDEQPGTDITITAIAKPGSGAWDWSEA